MRDIQEPPVRFYLVWSNEHDAWWKPNRRGYTHDVWQAGRYAEKEAAEVCRKAAYGWRGGSPPPEVMVLAPENGRESLTVDELHVVSDVMRVRAEEATAKAIAERKAAQQSGEAATR